MGKKTTLADLAVYIARQASTLTTRYAALADKGKGGDANDIYDEAMNQVGTLLSDMPQDYRLEVVHLTSMEMERTGQSHALIEDVMMAAQVSAQDFSSVSASTYIPEKVGVELGDVKLEMKSSDGYNSITIDRVEAIFHDNPSSEDYYSVKLKLQTKEATQSQMLLTVNEPLLNKRTKLDDDFGMDDYEYFGNAYIFNDRTINGKTYTLHLDTYSNSYRQSSYSFSYIVDLYKVTPEYYRFLKSINDAQSNSWADVGLMQVTPTYSNVKGGFGVVAGYNISSVSKYFYK